MAATTTQNGPTATIERALPEPSFGPAVGLEAIFAETERRKLALEPRDQDEAWTLCNHIAKVNLHGVNTPEDALARVLMGRSLGLPAMASIQGIALLWSESQQTNTTVMYVKLKLALLQSRKDIIEYIRPKLLTNEKAIWVGKRRGPNELEQEYEFTIEDARIAGLVGRGKDDAAKKQNNYDKHPGPMLQWRACGRLCDIIGADLLFGIATREEIEDENRSHGATSAARAAIASLDAKLEGQAAPAGRDFGAEAEELKKQIAHVAETKDKASATALRAAFADFKKAAPAKLLDDVQAAYLAAFGNKKADAAAPPAATPPAETPPHDPATGEVFDGKIPNPDDDGR